jgi:hypothetical protein
MKMQFFMVMVFLLTFSCKDKITVNIEKEPGTITGRVIPAGIDAMVELYQGTLSKQKQTDADGYFKLRDIDAGTYTLKIQALHYGSQEIAQIHVDEGEGHDVGTIQLSAMPYPLTMVSPPDDAREVSVSSGNVIIFGFNEQMNIESVKNSFSIVPSVENLTITAQSPNPLNEIQYFYIRGNFQLGTSYTLTMDSTAQTLAGELMEFSYQSHFQTEYFKIVEFDTYYPVMEAREIYILFNSLVYGNDLLENLNVEPAIEMNAVRYVNQRMYIVPVICWIPDTTFTITVKSSLQDVDGNYLQEEGTFSFTSEPLRVEDIAPYNNQYFVPTNQPIYIRMNYVIDESSIEQALSISPAAGYEINTEVYSGESRIIVYPDSLQPQTTYTVTLSTSLRDFYGGHLKEPFALRFVTR